MLVHVILNVKKDPAVTRGARWEDVRDELETELDNLVFDVGDMSYGVTVEGVGKTAVEAAEYRRRRQDELAKFIRSHEPTRP